MNELILVVEDNEAIRRLIRFLLEREGYRVATASNGGDGIRAAKQEQPSLILMDVMMREIDGFEACRKIKEAPGTQNIPVVFLSARGHESAKAEGVSLGAAAYIVKPFEPEEMLSMVRGILDNRPLKV
jgi:DNA-binding response OmpR family regulator